MCTVSTTPFLLTSDASSSFYAAPLCRIVAKEALTLRRCGRIDLRVPWLIRPNRCNLSGQVVDLQVVQSLNCQYSTTQHNTKVPHETAAKPIHQTISVVVSKIVRNRQKPGYTT
ncbi:unnamed protein product [Protopolystoma xenopodis]|uniref:Uncharacterized protein n=1 Tax=Protopolystoma xenopodis TaxID=117903 RepID=A0A448WWH5_9PLAT|nr:unnamed protein product [Protopolystoma xenopodis]